MRDLRDAALTYADRGWAVIPLRQGAKQPATRNGLKDASDDLITVLQWWQPHLALRDHNVGIVANPSGLVIVDIDPRHGGDDTLAVAERKLGPLPQTVEVETGGGGWHYYFRHPGGTLRGQLGEGVDIKDFGYVLAPPSLHPSGRRYEWSVDGHPDEVEVAELPAKWVNALQVSTRVRERTVTAGPSNDPLRHIPAMTYVARLTGREPVRGWFQCPLHGGGTERTPSLSCDGHLWACHGCPAPPGQRCQGGNIYGLAALLLDLPAPPRGGDYLEVKDYLKRKFNV